MIVCLNGQFLDHKKARISPLDNGFLYGDGFYDTMRTYDGRVLELDLHLQRVEKSALRMGIRLPVSTQTLLKWIQKTVLLNKVKEVRVRITVTRGEHGFDFLSSKKPTILVTCEPLVLDAAIYKSGVAAFTMRLSRVFPEMKTLGLTTMMVAYREILPKGGYEALLVDADGYVREGASTNVFVVKKGVLYTPKTQLLSGQTRAAVLAIARKKKIPCKVQDFKQTFLRTADEIFLTNRPREIIPVVRLNGKKVGNGKVGPWSKQMLQFYHEYVKEALMPPAHS